MSSESESQAFRLRPYLNGTQLLQLLEQVVRHVEMGTSFEQYLQSAGLAYGISGYINHTVPASLFCWLTWPDQFRHAVEQIVIAGGDTDTTGAIVGALAGITGGPKAIPKEWTDGLIEWPRTIEWMERLAERLNAALCGQPEGEGRTMKPFWPGLVARNAFFLCVVLVHGFRRLLPPY